MVKEGTRNNKKHFICEECGLAYTEKEWADKCEAWCKDHNSCNIEIIRHSIKEVRE